MNEEPRKKTSAYPMLFAALLPAMVATARRLGYALAVHGSMNRDLDVVAIPWTEEAVSADELAETLRVEFGGHTRLLMGQEIDRNPTPKAHGRRCYSYYFDTFEEEGKQTSWGPYLDLSVMPRRPNGHHFDDEFEVYEGKP